MTATVHSRRSTHTAIGALIAAVAVLGALNPPAVLAALVTGILNTAAGGGAIVTFLALTALGVPALTAHATSQLVTPASFLGAARLATDYRPGAALLVTGCLGTLVGVAVLAVTPPGAFRAVAPFVLVPAAVLVMVGEPVKRRVGRVGRTLGRRATAAAMFACGVYAGLVGVGTGTLALVVLGLTPVLAGASLPDLLRTRNVLLLGMAVLVAAAFAATGLADWALAAQLVLPGALGGWLGTRLVGRLPVPVLQAGIVATAIAGAVWMMLR
ncbi:MAG TPA: sulfite exporter TauE/SafE family protein [Actinophytocola sp.]|uniref:sulfite exporter TauE/SafE family protein n=1 Tax=Actinophytocola sp. TaxID=1872138 RepID=UPI002DDD69BA|nr:sulfite exporter TauE/SafE family protein [Actinophytocola sp.]HEV2782824.1 sulfite exporter TauE/SafE family protein [Actinophytocola sp.]